MTIATLLIALIATPSGDTAGEPLLLDFHASWCGPCQQMRPAIKELTRRGYPVKSIDVEEKPELAARYKVVDVPTFIVIDAAGKPLAQIKGSQPAGQLEQLFVAARSKMPAVAPRREPRDADAPADADLTDRGDDRPAVADQDEPADDRPSRTIIPTNPKPWETVVRIKVHGQGSMGFGSGTIIHSTPEESIILTCAHIFKLEGRQQAPPSRFPRRIEVDLFDGKLSGQMVHYANESHPGQAIDYDFGRDVGLIRIRPGRRLPASRVVPAHWKPQPRMLLTTVGCSEGRDATTWSTTIINPSMRGLSGNPQYEAIECNTAPKQGRSGGGLYTTDGYIAGVCDFAEPRGNHGLYASPASIYSILDRNNLMACYAPVKRDGSSQTLLANNRPNTKTRRQTSPAIARAQSPDPDESNTVMIPPPELLGIKPPAGDAPARTAATSTRNTSPWHATPSPGRDRTEQTDLTLGPELDPDRFGSMAEEPDPRGAPDDRVEEIDRQPQSPARSPGKWRPVRTPMTALSPAP
jgi:thiol-disulfide isomerase/thioredoxin